MALLFGRGERMIAMIVLYVLIAINLLFAANVHGEPRDNWSFPAMFISQLLSLALILWINGWKFI